MTIHIKSKTRLTIAITVFLLIIISVLSFFLQKGKAQVAPSCYLNWCVSSGDTLWTIAKNSLPKGRDIRDYIIEIREWNKLDSSSIAEGQLLEIPIYEINGNSK
ncbi:MAG TPA: LysM peptidoglycan-binding domain-containing protein [Clostridiales bacterium]|jgi:hypothetical protein|nr:LysM peptidoglycan-binding domain-containing protein [Clostridiales bacterium]